MKWFTADPVIKLEHGNRLVGNLQEGILCVYNKWLKGRYILCDYALFVGYNKPQKKKTRGSEISTTNSRNGGDGEDDDDEL